jgi:hypothetical protein
LSNSHSASTEAAWRCSIRMWVLDLNHSSFQVPLSMEPARGSLSLIVLSFYKALSSRLALSAPLTIQFRRYIGEPQSTLLLERPLPDTMVPQGANL